MAGGMDTVWANNVLTYLFTTATIPPRPTSYSVALYTDAVALDASGNPVYAKPTTEATATNCPGYARQTVGFGATAATGGTISNAADFAFTATSGPWTQVTYTAVLDQTGAIIDWGPMGTPRTLQVQGDKIDWAAGSFTIGQQ